MKADMNITALLDDSSRTVWTVDQTMGGFALPVAARDIKDSQREGDGLVLTLVDGRIIVVKDFYAVDVTSGAVLMVADGFGNLIALDVTDEGKIESLDGDGIDVAEAVVGEDTAGEISKSEFRVALARVEEMFAQHGQEFDSAELAEWKSKIFRQAEDADGDEGGFNLFSGTGLALIGGLVLAAVLASSSSGDDNGGNGTPTPDPGGTPDPGDGTPDPGDGTPDPGDGTPDPGDGTPEPGDGTPDPSAPANEQALERIIGDPDTLIVDLADEAGLQGVSAGNSLNQDTLLANLIRVLEAELSTAEARDSLGSSFEERLQRLQSLIGSVNELVDEDETILQAESGSLLLEIDSPDDGTGDVDRVVFVEQRDDFLPAEVRIVTAPDSGTIGIDTIRGSTDDLSFYDRIEVFEFDSDGNVVSKSIDDSGTPGTAADGSVDTVERYRPPTQEEDKGRITSSDRLTEVETRTYDDANSDGTADGDVTESEVDTNNDGSVDERREYTYDANGSVAVERVSRDSTGDGSFDVEVTRYYDGTGSEYDYEVYDGGGDAGTPDGTFDRLVFADDRAHSLTLTPGLAREFAGLGMIDMAGSVRSTIAISDEVLTELAGGASNYQLTIDGENNDSVVLVGDTIYRTGVTTDGRHEYQGTDGTILIATAVRVSGAVEPLVAVLRYLDDATLAMIELAGLSGIDADNLQNVKSTFGAFSAGNERESLSLVQVQGLVNAVMNVDYVPADASVEGGSWTAGARVLALDVSMDSDSTVDLRVELTLDSVTFAVQSTVFSYDEDSDGRYERVETDADGDGIANLVSYDPDDDVTVEYTLSDSDDDGTPDTLAFVDGVPYDLTLGIAETAEFLGITRIDMASGVGLRRLEIGDAALTRLSDRNGDGAPDSDYSLTIDGAEGGSVIIGGDEILDTVDSDTPPGYRALRGTNGIIYVDTDVSVNFAQAQNLQDILDNLGSAGVDEAKFAAAGISGVTSANIDIVNLLIGAWDATTTPARADLTHSQVQNLVEIAIDDRVAAGGTIEAAELVSDALTLEINTDADTTVEQQVALTLDSSLAPTTLARRIDTSGDGTRDDRTETDSNYDGTADHTVVRTDADNDGTYEMVVSETRPDGTLQTRVTDTDDNDDGTRNERRTEQLRSSDGSLEELRVESNTDDDASMVDVVTITSYEGAGAAHRAIDERVETDSNDDGTADNVQESTLDEMGRKERTEFDDNADTTVDRSEIYAYLDGSIAGIAYTLFDGNPGTDDRADGTTDRWAFGTADDLDVDLTSAPALTGQVAGVREIQLPGNDQSVGLTISDAVLTAMASPGGTLVSDYSFTVDGVQGTDETNDDELVIVGGVIYQTGVVLNGRDEYQGSNAKIYAGPNVIVTGAMDPLAAVLTHLDTATLAMFNLIGGLTDVSQTNLDNVKMTIGAFTASTTPAREDLTLMQVQGLVNIVNDPAILGATDTLIGAGIVFGDLALAISSDTDPAIERAVLLSLDATNFGVAGKVTRHDADGDSAFEKFEYDADNDGRTELINYDTNGDGTVDFTLHDGMGTDDDNGTPDRLSFANGQTFSLTLTPALAMEFAGIGTIDLADDLVGTAVGATTFAISDTDLTALSKMASGYQLIINGQSNDSVMFSGGIYDTGRTVGGRDEFRGTDGTVLVQSVVSVGGTMEPLAALREHLAEATVEMFALAGVDTAVPPAALASVRTVMGTFDVASLTADQINELVELTADYVLSVDGTVQRARIGGGGSLFIDVDTVDDADVEREIVALLTATDFSPSSLSVRDDLDGDGVTDRWWEDDDADGIANAIEYDLDDDGTKDVTLHDDGTGGAGDMGGAADDGTADRLVFDDGADVTLEIPDTGTASTDYAGIRTIQLAGEDGSNVGDSSVIFNNADMDRIFGTGEGDTLTINGDANDEVRFLEQGVAPEETSSTATHDAYRVTHENRLILVSKAVTFLNASDQSLEDILNAVPAATVENFESAGILEVTAGNLDNVKTILSAFESDTNTPLTMLTRENTQHLVNIATNMVAVPTGATIRTATAGIEGTNPTLTLAIDTDNVAGEDAELSVVIRFTSSTNLLPLHWSRSEDLDSDGTADDELRIWNNDDASGSPQRIETYYFNDSGGRIATLYDESPTGTADRLEFEDGVAHSMTLTDDLAMAFAGIGTIDLADDVTGSDGATTLVISDAHLATMAGTTTDYSIVIEGEADDTVEFSGGVIYRTGNVIQGTVDGVMVTRHEYQGSSGKVAVNSEVVVMGALDPRIAVLRHIEDATMETFALVTGLTGVNANNLENLKTMIQGFGDSTMPVREDLTVQQMQGLVTILGDTNLVPAGAKVVVATMQANNILRLNISTDATDETSERILFLTLDNIFMVMGASIGVDTNNDGDIEYSNRDFDYDGTLDLREEYTYHQGERIRVLRLINKDDMGAYDETETDYIPDGTNLRYTLYNTDNAGNAERLEFEDGGTYTFEPTVGEAADFVGIDSVLLAGTNDEGVDGITTFVLSDAVLTAMADGTSDYSFAIDGSNDIVELSGGIYRTGGTDGSGRHEYQGTNGRVYVNMDLTVTGAPEPLAALLANIDRATLATFGLVTGISGVTDANLESVRQVVEAFGAESVTGNTVPALMDLTALQINALVGIVNNINIVPSGTPVIEAILEASNTLVLEIDTDADSTAEQRIEVVLDAMTLVPTGVTRHIDTDDDGTTNDRTDFDSDANGVYERTEVYVYNATGILVRTDYDGDDDASADGRRDLSAIDTDEDGTANRAEKYSYYDNGTVESTEFDDVFNGTVSTFDADRIERYTYNSEGDLLYTRFDSDADGSPNSLVFANDGTANLTLNSSNVMDFVGITSVTLAGGTGTTTFVLTDDAWMTLAGGDPSYMLMVDGGSDDTVMLTDSFAPTGVTGVGGRIEFELAPGKILVHPDVVVSGAADALDVILADPSSAVPALFPLAEVEGVTDNNIANIREVLTAFDGDAANPLLGLSMANVQGLVDIVVNYVETGETVTVEMLGTDDPRTLTLYIYTIDAGTMADKRATFVLNSGLGAVEARFDDDLDGTVDRVEKDANADGTIEESITFSATDDNDDGTDDWVETRRDANNQLTRKIVTTNTDNDEFSELLITTVYQNGIRYTEAIEFDTGTGGLGGNDGVADDGSVDKTEFREYNDVNGLEDVLEEDFDADGTIDSRMETTYRSTATRETVTFLLDTDDNGSFDEKRQIRYDETGSVAEQEQYFNVTSDEVTRTNRYFYNAAGDRVSVLEDSTADGTPDTLTFVEGKTYRFEPTESEAEPFVGMTSVVLAGDDGVTTFVISDAVLTVLAGANSGYVLNIDGGADDMVEITDKAIYATGSMDSKGRIEFVGTMGSIFVASDVGVMGGTDIVGALLARLDNATTGLFELAGFENVTDDNIENVRTLLQAFTDTTDPKRTDLTMVQLTNLIDYAAVVNEDLIVREGSTIESATFAKGTAGETDTLTLVIEWMSTLDATNTRTVVIELAPTTFAASSIRRTDDLLSDGVPGETRTVRDIDHDGNYESIEYDYESDDVVDYTLTDRDDDGTPDGLTIRNGVNRTLTDVVSEKGILEAGDTIIGAEFGLGILFISIESDEDGTPERVALLTFADDSGEIETIEVQHDSDHDGTLERVERDSNANGYFEEVEYNFDDAGDTDFTVYDEMAEGSVEDGTPDRLVFTDGARGRFALTNKFADELSGLSRIDLADDDGGVRGATDFVIWDTHLTLLAGSDSNYVLTINGSDNDTVEVDSKIMVVEGDRSDGYREYRGTIGTILIQLGVNVTSVQLEPLREILNSVSESTVDLFEQAAISGVNAANLNNVHKVLEAFNDDTSPTRAELTQSNVQFLVNIVNDTKAVPSGASIETASVPDSAMTPLTLEYQEYTVDLALDGDFRVLSSILTRGMWKEYDDDFNGDADRIEYLDDMGDAIFTFFDDGAATAGDDGTLDRIEWPDMTELEISLFADFAREIFGAFAGHSVYPLDEFTQAQILNVLETIEEGVPDDAVLIEGASVTEVAGTSTLTFEYGTNADSTADGSVELKLDEDYKVVSGSFDTYDDQGTDCGKSYIYDDTGALHYVSIDLEGNPRPERLRFGSSKDRAQTLSEIHSRMHDHSDLEKLGEIDLSGESNISLTISGKFFDNAVFLSDEIEVFGDSGDTVNLVGVGEGSDRVLWVKESEATANSGVEYSWNDYYVFIDPDITVSLT